MAIDIRRNYGGRSEGLSAEEKARKQAERERLMKEYLERGGVVEKCPPGMAIGASSLNKDKKPMWTEAEIRQQAKEREANGSTNSQDSGWGYSDE